MNEGGQQWVNKSTFARELGFVRSYLSKDDVLERLRPALKTGPDGEPLTGRAARIDLVLGRVIMKRETDTSKVRKEAPAAAPATDGDEELDYTPSTMDEARKVNIRLKNEQLALNLASEKKQTLPRGGVLAAAAQAGQAIRENLMALVPSLAERFASMNDPREIKTVMEGALRGCFESVMNDFNRRIQPSGAGNGQPSEH